MSNWGSQDANNQASGGFNMSLIRLKKADSLLAVLFEMICIVWPSYPLFSYFFFLAVFASCMYVYTHTAKCWPKWQRHSRAGILSQVLSLYPVVVPAGILAFIWFQDGFPSAGQKICFVLFELFSSLEAQNSCLLLPTQLVCRDVPGTLSNTALPGLWLQRSQTPPTLQLHPAGALPLMRALHLPLHFPFE